MRLWHLLLGIVVSAFVMAFVRVMGPGAIVTGIGMVAVLGALVILGFSDDIFRSLRRRATEARSRTGLASLAPFLSLCLLGSCYLVLAGICVLFLVAVLAFPFLFMVRI
ncbi:MAG: hypothetical protein JWN86_842 [Planctomycetota bacterium]|nr:hypothetical protein [Planctomycetota bacterium]